MSNNAVKLYLDLMENILVNTIYEDAPDDHTIGLNTYSYDRRERGRDWPSVAHSMIGLRRMRNVRALAQHAIDLQVPGDFMETGVWRGGASIMMRAVIAAYGDKNRKVVCADSFEGLPPPDLQHFPADKESDLHLQKQLAISLENVKDNFKKYNLLDDQVEFVKGFFKDTLPVLPKREIALLRLDGDLYESTIQALENLYPMVSVGGYVIIDDYYDFDYCSKAVHDYLEFNKFTADIYEIDGVGVWWRKSKMHIL